MSKHNRERRLIRANLKAGTLRMRDLSTAQVLRIRKHGKRKAR